MSLDRKVESAWSIYLSALPGIPQKEDASAAVYKGADPADLTRDRVVVACMGGPEEPQGFGNRRMRVSVHVVTGSDPEDDGEDSLGRHTANCAAVFDAIEKEIAAGTLAAKLSAAVDDFYVFDPVIDEGDDPDVEARGWIQSRQYMCYCCGVDIG